MFDDKTKVRKSPETIPLISEIGYKIVHFNKNQWQYRASFDTYDEGKSVGDS
jgi:hypothetical protein